MYRQYAECMNLASARKALSNAYPRVPGCWCIPLSCTGGLQGIQRCWNPWSFCWGTLWNRCRESGSCMLLASGWSEPAMISFVPDLCGRDFSFARFRSLGNYTWKEIWKKDKACANQHSMTSPMSMQYQAQISDHSTLGSSFHSLSRKVGKCHI